MMRGMKTIFMALGLSLLTACNSCTTKSVEDAGPPQDFDADIVPVPVADASVDAVADVTADAPADASADVVGVKRHKK